MYACRDHLDGVLRHAVPCSAWGLRWACNRGRQFGTSLAKVKERLGHVVISGVTVG